MTNKWSVWFLGALCAALIGSNAYLLHINKQLVRMHEAEVAMQIPAMHKPLPPIEVWGKAGPRHALSFAGDKQHLLLVMSPDCPFCKENWPMWQALLGKLPSNVDVTYFDVTGKFDPQFSSTHGIAEDQLITADVDSALKARITGTPTTVLLANNGAVKYVWAGVLDDQKIADILASVAN
jgi:thiol-disulfide isomerase/thioredoxin